MRLLLVLLLAFPAVSFAQDASELTNERIFSSPDFEGQRFGPARWLADGSGYTTVEQDADGAREIVRYDPASGERTVLVSGADLTPTGATTPIPVENYAWSDDGTKMLIYTNSKRVWRLNTRGDYWVLGLDSGRLHQIGEGVRPSTLMFAKFSPDGTRVGYVRENNVYVEDLETGHVTALTTNGSATMINGTFDWVYEEELDLKDGFRWSPDGTKVAYWQLDASGIGEFLMINNTDSLYSFTIPVQYPKAGTTNSASRIGIVSAAGGETVWVADSHNPREHYPARMDWAAGSEEILIQHLNRPQNENTVLLANAETGSTRTVFVDTDEAWLDAVNDLIWMDDGSRFTWVSERDGFRHVYVADRETGVLTSVTDGPYDIVSVAQIDTRGGWLYFIASLDNAIQRYLYRVPLAGGAEPERLSPQDQPGQHSYQVSPNGLWAIHTYSSTERAPIIDLVSLPDHRVVRTFVDNVRLQSALDAVRMSAMEFFQVETADGVTLDGSLIKPSDFDPSKKYPVLFYVYGEPWGQTVQDRWGGTTDLWHRMLAEKGYLVISIDNRGTPGPRNRAWRKSVYGEIGTKAAIDQAGALAVISEWPFVDDSRVGIWGWSGGGSMTLNMLFRYPGKYHVGMSVAPVPDQRFYDTIYQERYSGDPRTNPEGYRGGSPITYAENLEGDLLLVHGTGDDNVHFQGSETLINKLIKEGKQFTMFAYPNRSHGIFEGEGTTLHLRNMLTEYLLDHLPAGGQQPTSEM
ncbi:MAG: dipeptidyl-peptidase-4 [Rhodothermales bacterium]|jgi:dipeptidyl-peptidase-4